MNTMFGIIVLAASFSAADYPSISEAVADCAAKGGGCVTVAAGAQRIKEPVRLRSGVDLRLAVGAKLVSEGAEAVVADGVSDVRIYGEGTVEGGGIVVRNARRVSVEGLEFVRVPTAVVTVADGSQDVTVRNCRGLEAYRGLHVRGVRRGGTQIRDVVLDGLELVGQTEQALAIDYASGADADNPKPTRISSVTFRNVKNERSVWGVYIKGEAGESVRDVRLGGISFGAVRYRVFDAVGVEGVSYDGLPALLDAQLRSGSQLLNYSFHDEVFKRVVAADLKAEADWLACDTPEKLVARQRAVREKALAQIGAFPDRCPLEGRVTGRLQKEGYVIEKVVYQSRPGFHVTGSLFLPDNPAFKAPYPAIVVPCGHSSVDAKGGPGYQHAGVTGARAGFAVLVYDPIDQGERRQKRDGARSWSCVAEHNALGARAALVGLSQMHFRLWDGIRSTDYLCSRPEVDASRLGVMGMSGGGTMSSYINAFEPRIRCGAPAGFLSTVRDVYDNCGPQDAEQQSFGILTAGLNHLGIVCLRAPSPIQMTVSHDDFFPLMGAMSTYEKARRVFAAAGAPEAVALFDTAGPHTWYQSSQRASVLWMRRHLNGERDAYLRERAQALRFEDVGYRFTAANAGAAFDPPDGTVPAYAAAPGGRVLNIPGERTAYDILREEAAKSAGARAAVTPDRVRAATGIRPLSELSAPVAPNTPFSAVGEGGISVRGAVLQRRDDFTMIPVLTYAGATGGAREPVLVVTDAGSRAENAGVVRKYLDAGHEVVVADIRGFGETAFGRHAFYGTSHADEETAVMLYALGDSLVARRAEDIALVARHVRETLGAKPVLHAEGRAAIPAAHARYLEPDAFAGLALVRAPVSWSQALADETADLPFANVVNGALRVYDWTDLGGKIREEK